MIIQILVNHYNEEPNIVARLLRSIEKQDFNRNEYEVLIASDGDEHKLSRDFLAQFNFTIKYSVLQHKGVCATRNYLLDSSSAKYVMFCDADDCFSKSNGLSLLINAAHENDADVVGSTYSVENCTDGVFSYTDMRKDIVRVHGKIFRLKYVQDENIRYPDHVVSNGDMCFLWLAYNLTDKIIWLDDNFYIWKDNPKSLTRSAQSYKMQMYDRRLECYASLARDLISRNREDLYNKTIVSNIIVSYLNAHDDKWFTHPDEFIVHAETAMAKYIKEFRHYYDAVDEKYKYTKYNRLLIARRTYGPPQKYKGISPWMDEIVEKYG